MSGVHGRIAAATRRVRRAAAVLAGRTGAPQAVEPPTPVALLDAARWRRLQEANPALAGAVVRAAYLAVLRREPEPEGLAYHAERVANGLPVEVLLGDMAEGRHREDALRGGQHAPAAGDAIRVVSAVLAAALARPLEAHEREEVCHRLQSGDRWWAVLADSLEAGSGDGVARLRHLVMVQERALLAMQRRLAVIEDRLLAGDAPPLEA